MADIEIINSELTEIDKIDVPDLVYKYRTWSDPYHKRIISDQELYFAAPSSFEDLHDCKIPVRWDLLTKKEIFHKYLAESKEKNTEWDRPKLRQFAREWTKKSLIRDKKSLKPRLIEDQEEFDKRLVPYLLISCIFWHNIQ